MRPRAREERVCAVCRQPFAAGSKAARCCGGVCSTVLSAVKRWLKENPGSVNVLGGSMLAAARVAERELKRMN